MDSQSFFLLQSPHSWPCLACGWVPGSSGFFVMVCIFSHALSRTCCFPAIFQTVVWDGAVWCQCLGGYALVSVLGSTVN